jgi:hypothetical protein
VVIECLRCYHSILIFNGPQRSDVASYTTVQKERRYF